MAEHNEIALLLAASGDPDAPDFSKAGVIKRRFRENPY